MLTTREIAEQGKETSQAVLDRAKRSGEKPAKVYGRTWLWTPAQARKLSKPAKRKAPR